MLTTIAKLFQTCIVFPKNDLLLTAAFKIVIKSKKNIVLEQLIVDNARIIPAKSSLSVNHRVCLFWSKVMKCSSPMLPNELTLSWFADVNKPCIFHLKLAHVKITTRPPFKISLVKTIFKYNFCLLCTEIFFAKLEQLSSCSSFENEISVHNRQNLC